MPRSSWTSAATLAALLLAAASPVGAQAPAPPAAPQAPSPQAPAPQPPAPAGPSAPAGARATLLPDAGDPMNVDEVTLTGKPAAVLSGSSTWDDGFANLKKAFERLEGELAKAGIAPTGRPVTVFVETDDVNFRFEALIPIAQAPENRPGLGPDIRFGRTPDGRALRFTHKSAYDDIDSTYETITAYLDAKGVIVKDTFVEEYVGDLKDPAEDIEINVFALPK